MVSRASAVSFGGSVTTGRGGCRLTQQSLRVDGDLYYYY
jgi:hypothetical protein